MKSFRHVGIVVSNIEKSLYFYRDLLNLKVEKIKNEKGDYLDNILGLKKINIKTIKLSAKDGKLIELLYFYTKKSNDYKIKKIFEVGITHVAFTVNNLDLEYKRLLKKGVKFISKPKISPNRFAKVVFCKDPDGSFIELVEEI